MASDHRQRQCYYEKQREVDPAIWRACAGSLIHIPTVNSRVYYFPQGHIEQSSTTVSLSSMAVKHSFLCRLVKVSFLADVDTDEVFVKFVLEPLKTASVGFHFTGNVDGGGSGSGSGEKEVVSFAKVLTPSDANNGGGFSVPRFCADSIFPPLDFGADPPVQKIRITDIHGDPWEFRHIYRGTPRRHLLTTGWSKFVNSKKLIAGDSVVFMRNKLSNDLFVGIRRAFKMPVSGGESWGFVPKAAVPGVVMSGGGFTRTNRGRVPGEKVVEAVERAMSEVAFEVVYYPRQGLPEFVVEAEKVEVACGVYWNHGMKIKFAQETEDGARLSWFNGTIAKVVGPSEQGPWRGSPWRKLQVDWDEPDILQNFKTVNPWQVEIIAPTVPPSIHATFPPTKKFRGLENTGLLTDVEGDPPLPTMGFSSMMSQFSSSFLKFNTFPAGMQGARQNAFLVPTSLPNIMNDNHQTGDVDYNVDSSSQKRKTVPTELNIGSSPSETPSPDSQNSVQLFGMASTEQRSCNLTKKGVTSFQLFGKVIETEQPLASAGDAGSTEDDDFTIEGTSNTVENSSSDASKSLMMETDTL